MGIEELVILVALASLPAVALFAKRRAQPASESVESFTVGDRRYKLFRIGKRISLAFFGGGPTPQLTSSGVQRGRYD